MRVLSFIPTLLIAAASLVAAAPLPDASVPACAPATDKSPSNSAQTFIVIFEDTAAKIHPLVVQLTAVLKATEDEATVSGIVTQIGDAISAATTELNDQIKAAVLTSSDIPFVTEAVLDLFVEIYAFLACLGPYLAKMLSHGIPGDLAEIVCSLLQNVTSLVGCLKDFLGSTLGGIIPPAFDLVCTIVEALAGFLGMVL